ncbi:MAG: DUF2254 domain-containing protein [Actinomycetes bacterium]
MIVQLRALAERLRGSLFYVPAVCVAAAMALATTLARLDRTDLVPDAVPTLQVTVASARALLGTLAGATITVAGIVFSVTVVSVQLASSQASPRVLRGFLRDRFQQGVIGLVIGTFAYCTVVLAVTRARGSDETATGSVAVTVATLLAIASILAIIAFIDRSARSMQVGRIIRTVTLETLSRIESLYAERGQGDPTPVQQAPLPAGPSLRVEADAVGWVQQVNADALLAAVPADALVRLDTPVGEHVHPGRPVLTVWLPEGTDADEDEVRAHLRGALAVGDTRTMQQDVAFGIRQLVDIALRAMSPGINDPTTADEAVVHLAGVLTALLRHDLPPRVRTGSDGRVLVRPNDPDHGDLLDLAFDQLRTVAADEATVLVRLCTTLAELQDVARETERPEAVERVRAQADAIVAALDDSALGPHDRARVLEAAEPLRDTQ